MEGERAASLASLRSRIAAIESAPAKAARANSPKPQRRCGSKAGKALARSEGDDGQTAASAVKGAAAVRSAAPKDADEGERAFRKIERLCCARERASSELRDRLAREGFSASTADAAVDRALACGLVDDLRFAEVLIRSRLSAGKGRKGIEAELERLGISASSVPGWPDEFPFDEDSELARALDALRRRPPRAKNKRDAAYRRLVQKGFSSSVAAAAARRWAEALADMG